ncbi:hypothetical protein NW766_012451 [Fusarium irregulare]|uniref:Ankyrin n=1 Tax=Fusarium irregulare TaxID=2494466 RepID=A0A9W8PDG6_9HYPO|nr:hypothetical protein NW766_012451 [Fusarium irregulare]
MPWYMQLSSYVVLDPWQGSQELTNLKAKLEGRIVNLYQAVLGYQMDSVVYCYAKNKLTRGLRTVWDSVDWKARVKDLEDLQQQFGNELAQYSDQQKNNIFGNIATTSKATLAHLQEQSRHTNTTERLKVVSQFRTTRYEEYMAIHPPRAWGTFEWLRRNDRYISWSQQNFGLLLLSAGPRSGKSVLTKYLVEDVLPFSGKAPTVAYFFFGHSPEQNSMTSALSAIIHQILYRLPELVSTCQEEIHAHGSALTSDFLPLWKVFKKLVDFPNERQIVCVLDGLDACVQPERKLFTKLLKDFLKYGLGRRPSIKFLITTREDLETLEEFQGITTSLALTFNKDMDNSGASRGMGQGTETDLQIRRDFDLVMEYDVNALVTKKGLSSTTYETITYALGALRPEPTTYIWMSQMINDLSQNLIDTPERWQTILNSDPQSLFQQYEAMLQGISGEEVRWTRTLFHLVLAAEKPLTLHEMNIAMHVRGRRNAYTEAEIGLPSDESFQKWIILTCKGFVTIFQGRIFFIHHTAETFLLKGLVEDTSSGETMRSCQWQGSITIPQAHRAMAETCVAYLSLGLFTSPKMTGLTRKFNQGLKEAQEMFWDEMLLADNFLDHGYEYCAGFLADLGLSSFSLYALQCWAAHFRLSQELSDDGSCLDIGQEFDEAYFDLFDDIQPFTKPWLVMTAQLLEEDCGYRLTEFDIHTGNVQCHHLIGLASLASLFGHYRLLKKHLGVDPTAIEPPTFLTMACANTDHLVIEPPSPSFQPCFFAAGLGHSDCLDLILDKQTLENAQDLLQRTPLHQAVRLGRYNCFESLIGRFDIYQPDRHGFTALDSAIHRSIKPIENLPTRRHVLRILARAKEQRREATTTNTKTNKNVASLLSIAAQLPNDTFLEELYYPQSIEEAKDTRNIRSSRLFRMAYKNSVIKYLVDCGEDVNERGDSQFTPLHVASLGNLWNVEFLLHAGADVFAVDEDGCTPLHIACRWTWESSQSLPPNLALILGLLEAGACPNEPDYFGETPFMLAILHFGVLWDSVVESMLAYGADPFRKPANGLTPFDVLQVSAKGAKLDIIESWIFDTSMLWDGPMDS